jgi:hypothetical protein
VSARAGSAEAVGDGGRAPLDAERLGRGLAVLRMADWGFRQWVVTSIGLGAGALLILGLVPVGRVWGLDRRLAGRGGGWLRGRPF